MIKQVNFLKSAAAKEHWIIDDVREVCFLGRSNVGKSSFINAISNNKRMAKTSQTPGKTCLLNFFDINNSEFRIVDCPGYGYSKLPKNQQDEISYMIQDYLMGRENLKFVCQLIDLRHEPTKDDLSMNNFLKKMNIPILIIGTKLDKLKKNDILKNKNMIIKILNINADEILLTSSTAKTNIDLVYKKFLDFLNK